MGFPNPLFEKMIKTGIRIPTPSRTGDRILVVHPIKGPPESDLPQHAEVSFAGRLPGGRIGIVSVEISVNDYCIRLGNPLEEVRISGKKLNPINEIKVDSKSYLIYISLVAGHSPPTWGWLERATSKLADILYQRGDGSKEQSVN